MVEIFDNIRKIYQFSPPCEELASYIEFFSESSPHATHAFAGNDCFTVKMFASLTPTFWINLGTSYYLTLGNKHFLVPGNHDILLTRDTIVERYNQPADHIFTVKFYPGALESVLGVDQSQMAGKLVPLQQVLPASLIMRIKVAGGFYERKKLLEDHFLDQLKTKRARTHYIELVTKTIAMYEGGSMKYNVDELAERLFMSSKTINRYFNKVVGITPKKYLSIMRCRTALTAFVANKQAFDPAVYGYHDMSHFYKEAIKFTGERMIDHGR
ncbi:helix-turn-helix domain-containing protein [Niastella sp. OAS944]|uniref:helix-turn-helix domain-containing protein n=1 Tax=Niastella sp. OAS944 TaxID=2664089 RepID=UPI00347EB1C3|nr:AraC-like DNA-binding protein [Chitinophagaceae bacterium OAS944]